MAGLFSKVLGYKKTWQSCVVIAGDDILTLSQAFIAQKNMSDMYVYQVVHHATQQNFEIIDQKVQATTVRFNLHDVIALKQFVQYIQREGHKVDLLVLQPTFISMASQCSQLQADVQQSWQNSGLNAVNMAQGIIPQMLSERQGTVIFLGNNPAQIKNNQALLSLSMSAAIRALAQSLAREFQPKGIHIVYLMLPDWNAKQLSLMQSIAEMCTHLHHQPKSTWSHEICV